MVNWQCINGRFSLEWDGLQVYRSEKFILVVKDRNSRSKILQIVFWKNGSIFVDFPYFAHTSGIISLVTYPGHAKPPIKLSYLDGGKVTSHLVKFSYPPDGHAHFSQDGKVYSKVRKDCPPIREIEGHLFTAQIQGLDSFSRFDPTKEKMSNLKERIYMEADFGNRVPPAVKIVGMLYTRKEAKRRSTNRFFGPIMETEDPQGNKRLAYFCSWPTQSSENSDLVLMLMCESIPRIDKHNVAALSFIGGFDNKTIVGDWTKDSTFLALNYPAENIAELARKIGSIDFIRPAKLQSNTKGKRP